MSFLPINPNASQKTKDLLTYIYSISGSKTLTGIHSFIGDPNEFANHIKNAYGDYAAVQGFEMGPIENQSDATIASLRQNVINAAINHHNRGGIVTMMWHQNYPLTAYIWASVNRATTQAEFDRICTSGTAEYNWLIAEYDKVAEYLKQLRDANIPVLWRPYHEMNGRWFWWGWQPNYYRLWDIMYNRFTNVHGLNNLLWVWNANAPKSVNKPVGDPERYENPYSWYFVGADKCDILGTDLYMIGGETWLQSYHDELDALSGGKPLAVAEIGQLFPISTFTTQPKWAWFMEWGNYLWDANTQAQRDAMFTTSETRTYNLSEVSIPTSTPSTPDTQAPTVPTNITSTTRTTASINLSWAASTDNVAVAGYDVYMNGSLKGSTNTNSYNATGLIADTTYTFKVRAKDAAGNMSAFSADMLAKTDLVNTNFVRGINLGGTVSVVVEGQTWLAGNDPIVTLSSGTQTHINSPSVAPVPAVDTDTSTMLNSNIYSNTGLTVSQPLPNGSYQVYVWALENYQANFRSFTLNMEGVQVTPNPIGNLSINGWAKYGAYPVTVTDGVLNVDLVRVTGDAGIAGMAIFASGTLDTLAPTVPTALTSPSKTSTSVDLSWTASTDNVGVTGYDVYAGANLKGTTATTSFTVTGLTASTSYSFTVKAKDAAGNVSGDSNTLSITTNASSSDTTAPTIPTGLNSPSKTATSINLSWTASTDNVAVTGYDVYRNNVLIGTTATTTYSATGLTASTSYAFKVRAKDAAGNVSGDSSVLNVTTNTLVDTQAPTSPTSLVSPKITSTTVDLSWVASTDNVGVTGYDVYKDGSIIGSTTTNTTYTVTGLTPVTNYNFKIRAKDAAGNISTDSNILNVSTLKAMKTYYPDFPNATSINSPPLGRGQLAKVNGSYYVGFGTAAIEDWIKLVPESYVIPATSISSAPLFLGQTAIVSGVIYKAIGTSSASDWKKLAYDTSVTTLFSDYFERTSTTTLGTGWTAESGVWGTNGTKAYVPANTSGALAFADTTQENYTLNCLLNGCGWSQGSNASVPMILVRYIDVSNFLSVHLYNGQMYFNKYDAGVETTLPLQQVAATVSDGTDHTIKIVTSGDRIQVYLDNVSKVDYTLTGANATKFGDAANLTKVGFKLIRFGTPTTEAKWDDFVVTT